MAASKAGKTKPKAKARKSSGSASSAKDANVYDAPSVAQQRKWMAESDMRTLREAAMIQADPKRMKEAAKMAIEELKALQKIKSMA